LQLCCGENRHMRVVAWVIALVFSTNAFGQQKPEPTAIDTGSDLLWKKLVAILDLTDGRIFLHNADRVFPTASSIKIAILLESYRQDQEARTGAKNKAKLDDIYTFDPQNLVEDSQIMAGLTTGVTRVTNRDLAQFMVAVSDNTAANILIESRWHAEREREVAQLRPDENKVAQKDDGRRCRSTRR